MAPDRKSHDSAGLLTVARSGLAATDKASVSFDAVAWATLLSSVSPHKLEGLLVHALDAGVVSATADQKREALDLHRASMNWVLVLDGTLALIARELDAAGVEFRLLKGASLAYGLYRDPAMRPYVDIDLLVRGDQFGEAAAVIEEFGLTRRGTELRPGFDQQFGKGATFSRSGRPSIDLHRTFVAGPFAMIIDADSLFDRSQTLDIGGMKVKTLALEEQFLHACFSAAVSDYRPKLMALRDVVESSRDPQLEADRIGKLARKWRAEAVVAKALNAAWDTLRPADPNPLSRWPSFETPPRSSARLLAAYETEHNRWRRQAIAGLPLVKGNRARWSYLRAMVNARAE